LIFPSYVAAKAGVPTILKLRARAAIDSILLIKPPTTLVEQKTTVWEEQLPT
jgi:hypothetical protein